MARPTSRLCRPTLSEGRTDRFDYYAFDLLHLDGYDLRQVPLMHARKLLLRAAACRTLRASLRFSEHFDQDGDMSCGMPAG